jgi:hypothetical protein
MKTNPNSPTIDPTPRTSDRCARLAWSTIRFLSLACLVQAPLTSRGQGDGPPIITEQSYSQVVAWGSTVVFHVVAQGAPPLFYQWYLNDMACLGANDPSLTLYNVGPMNAGAYTVRVMNAYGEANSVPAVLADTPFLVQPQSQTVDADSAATFSVQLFTNLPPAIEGYQWYFNQTNALAQETNAVLTIGSVQPAHAGDYTVVAGNAYTSHVARLNVVLTIPLGEALDATNLAWTTGGDAAWFPQANLTHDGVDAARSAPVTEGQESWVETTVTGPGTVAFWWRVSSEMDADFLEFYLNEVLQRRISGEVDWEQASVPVPAGDSTLRWRYVKDVGTDVGEDCGWLDVVAYAPSSGPPRILAEPVNRTAGLGDSVVFTVGAAGEEPLTYRWFRNRTTVLTQGSDASVALTNLSLAEAGDYTVIVSNHLGSATSQSARLQVTANGPVKTILLFLGARVWGSPYEDALNRMGNSYQTFTNYTALNLALSSTDPGTTLVVVGAPAGNYALNRVGAFAEAGGRVLLEYWGLTPGSDLAAALGAQVVQGLLPSPQPVYDWGGSPFFERVTAPLSSFWLTYDTHGERLEALTGGQAVAGYSNAVVTDQAAIVVAHSGRTVLNGFLPEELSSSSDAVQLAQNEIEFLLQYVSPGTPPRISRGDMLTNGSFRLQFDATTGASYSVLASPDLTAWDPIGTATEISPGVFEFTDVEALNYAIRFYRLSLP